MRISAIQSGIGRSPLPKTRKTPVSIATTTPEIGQDTVNFKGNEVKKGIGIGAAVGIAALTLISGGAATPLAYGAYAAIMGTAGGMVGSAVKDVKNRDKDSEDN